MIRRLEFVIAISTLLETTVHVRKPIRINKH